MKKIHTLKKEKEILAMNYEQEEEYLTNDLSKKLLQVFESFCFEGSVILFWRSLHVIPLVESYKKSILA